MKINDGLIEKVRVIIDNYEQKILATKHGDALTVKTSIEFCDRSFNAMPEFIEGKSIGLFASISVYAKGKESVEDECYGYSMIFDFEEKGADPESVLQREEQEFTTELDRFITELEATDDAEAFIIKESETADKEAKAAMDELNESLAKTKKYTMIGFGVIIALFIALIIIKAIT